jgi:hypothetical protein
VLLTAGSPLPKHTKLMGTKENAVLHRVLNLIRKIKEMTDNCVEGRNREIKRSERKDDKKRSR